MSRREQAKQFVEEKRDLVIRVSNNLLQKLGIGFWILILLIFVVSFFFLFNLENIIKLAVSDYGYVGIFTISFISDFLVQPIGPDIPLLLGMFSPVLKTGLVFAVVLAGSYCALFLSYHIGRIIGSRGIEKIVGEKTYRKILKNPAYGKWILFLGALTPIPYIPYLAGLWELSFRETMWYVVIPRTVRFAFVLVLAYYIGAGVFEIVMI